MSRVAEGNDMATDKVAFQDSVNRFLRVYGSTPDDRVNWSPTTTARTPNQIAAHVAMALESILNMAKGNPFPIQDVAEADKSFRTWEMQFSDRSEIVRMIEERSKAIVDFMESCSSEDLDFMMTLPFRLGAAPRRIALKLVKMHTDSHTPQIEYIQTCYGDWDWRMEDR